MLLQDRDGLALAVVPLREVRLVLGLRRVVEHVVQRLRVARQRTVDRVDDRLPVDAERDRLAHPRSADHRVRRALALTELEVLHVVAGDLVERDPGDALEREQVRAEGRRDRVDFAAAHGLDLGIRVLDDLEVDLGQARLLAVPERVRLQGRALTLRVVRKVERAVRDGLPVATANAVRPDLVEVLARECRRRIERREHARPVRIRAAREVRRATRGLPLEGDRRVALMGVVDRIEVAVAGPTRCVGRRIVDLLERVDEVLVRHGHLLAAPPPTRTRANRVRKRLRVRRRRRNDVLDPLALVVLHERAVQRLVGAEEAARELVAARQDGVEAVDVLLLAEDEDRLRLAAGSCPGHLCPRLCKRRRGRLCSGRAGDLGRRRGRGPCHYNHSGSRSHDEPEASVHRNSLRLIAPGAPTRGGACSLQRPAEGVPFVSKTTAR